MGYVFPRKHIERQVHFSAGRRVFEGVGQQVHRDFLHLVDIGPHDERLFQPVGGKVDLLRSGIEAEQFHDALQGRDDVGLGHFQLKLAVADAVEIEQLVHQREHPRGVALDNADEFAVSPLYIW